MRDITGRFIITVEVFVITDVLSVSTYLSSFSSAWSLSVWYLCSSCLTLARYSWAHFFSTSSFCLRQVLFIRVIYPSLLDRESRYNIVYPYNITGFVLTWVVNSGNSFNLFLFLDILFETLWALLLLIFLNSCNYTHFTAGACQIYSPQLSVSPEAAALN